MIENLEVMLQLADQKGLDVAHVWSFSKSAADDKETLVFVRHLPKAGDKIKIDGKIRTVSKVSYVCFSMSDGMLRLLPTILVTDDDTQVCNEDKAT